VCSLQASTDKQLKEMDAEAERRRLQAKREEVLKLESKVTEIREELAEVRLMRF